MWNGVKDLGGLVVGGELREVRRSDPRRWGEVKDEVIRGGEVIRKDDQVR